MANQKRAYLFAIIAVILWATVASAFKISLEHLDYLQLLLIASGVSLLSLLVVLIAQQKINLFREFSTKDVIHSALLGFLNPFIYYIVLFKAYSLLPAQEAQPLNYTWPIMLVLLSVPLLKQKISFKSLIAIIVSFFGVLIISTRGDIAGFGFSNLSGALLALCTAVVWAFFWIMNMKDGRDETSKLFLNFLFGFIYIFLATAFFSEVKIPMGIGLMAAIYVGLFEMGLTFVVWSNALKWSESTAKVTKFIYLVPFLSLIVIHFVVGEKIYTSTVIGLLFIVAGIVLEQVKIKLKKVTHEIPE